MNVLKAPGARFEKSCFLAADATLIFPHMYMTQTRKKK